MEFSIDVNSKIKSLVIYRTWNVYRLPKQVVFLFTLYSILYNNIINNSNNNNNNNSNNTIIVIISVTSTYVLFNSGITVQKMINA